jgi:hypothetical protein
VRKHKAAQQKRQARQQAKARRSQRREERRPVGKLRRNQIGIAKKLLAGEVPLVCATAWGFVEGLLSFMLLGHPPATCLAIQPDEVLHRYAAA